jgi:serine/threonine-protein kinase RsbW
MTVAVRALRSCRLLQIRVRGRIAGLGNNLKTRFTIWMMSDPSQNCNFDAQRLTLKMRVTLSADPGSIDPVVQGVMDVVRQIQCAPGKEDAIELALTEALANAVVHGAKGDSSKVIECDVACNEARSLLIVVRDPGEGFDPGKIPSPLQGERLYSDHGRGIYLINQLMDEVNFAKNGTEIRMIKR